jgi:F420-0:gamma-glutamyl ligase-like protein
LPPCAEKYLKELIILAKEAEDYKIKEKKTKTIKPLLEDLSKLKFHLTQENLLREDVEKAH